MDRNKNTLFRGKSPVMGPWLEQSSDGMAAKNVGNKTIDEKETPKVGGTEIKQWKENKSESKLSYEVMDGAAQTLPKPKIMDNIYKLERTDTEMRAINTLIGDGNWKEAYKKRHQSPKIAEGLPCDTEGT